VCTVAETVLLIAVGMLIDNLHLPTSPERWWTFAWVFVLGTVCFSLLGIAISSVPRSARAAPAVIMLPFTVLQFISGVYVPATLVPAWLRARRRFAGAVTVGPREATPITLRRGAGSAKI
jgi:ABC-2 type transport system permease protein